MKCNQCGAPMDDKSRFCESCGAPAAPANSRPCPGCGMLMKEDLRYCIQCGSAMEQVPLVPAEQTERLCPDCGAKVGADFLFCRQCGAQLIEKAPVSSYAVPPDAIEPQPLNPTEDFRDEEPAEAIPDAAPQEPDLFRQDSPVSADPVLTYQEIDSDNMQLPTSPIEAPVPLQEPAGADNAPYEAAPPVDYMQWQSLPTVPTAEPPYSIPPAGNYNSSPLYYNEAADKPEQPMAVPPISLASMPYGDEPAGPIGGADEPPAIFTAVLAGEYIICPACGTSNLPDASFCANCGAKTSPPAAKRKKKRKVIRIIILILLLLGLVAGGYFWLKSRENKEDSIPASASESEPVLSSAVETSEPESVSEQALEPIEEVKTYVYSVDLSIEPRWDMVSGFDSSGLARVREGDYWGLIGVTGNYVALPQYSSINYYFDDLAVVDKGGRYGYIDMKGNEVIAPQFDNAFSFNDGLAVVVTNKKFGYINTTGDIAIEPLYDYARSFSGGFAPVSISGKYFYIDEDGIRASQEYDDAMPFSEGYAAVCVDDRWGYINDDFSLVIDCLYDSAIEFVGGYAIVELDEKQFFIDESGDVMSIEVDELWQYAEGYATAMENDRYGYIDQETGDWAVGAEYVDVYSFADALCPVSPEEDVWYFIDGEGAPQFDREFEFAHKFYDGLARVKQDGLYGILDAQGNLIEECSWEDAGIYSGGMFAVMENGLWGFLRIEAEVK